MTFIKTHIAGFITGISVAVALFSAYSLYQLSNEVANDTYVLGQIVSLINNNIKK